jgi:catechol 2,3-dioxygenase-like lactoylglutathione lyase family enzyme
MAVKRIVANLATERVDTAKAFYGDALGMNVVMDLGWIITFAADGSAAPQISVATEGGSGTPVPDLSIEVDDVTDVRQRMETAGFKIEYGPVIEPWGVKRFYVRDPLGRLVNILEHQ